MSDPSITRGILPQDLLAHMRVEDGLYVLGCLERRVTLHSQQIRALNLVYSLCKLGIVKPGEAILIIGGGVAGLTAAAGAARLGLRVTLLEREHELLHLQRSSMKRWIHPHIYDWPAPGSTVPEATVPLLRWRAAPARDVAQQVLSAFDTLPERAQIDVHVGAELTDLGRGSTRHALWQARGNHDASVSAIILAVGFGLERDIDRVELLSYWQDDSLDHALSTNQRRILVSGIGDGGLIDALRASVRDFRHDTMIDELVGDAALAPVKERLLAIEEQALAEERRTVGTGNNYLFQAYKKLSEEHAEVLSRTVDINLRRRLREGVKVVLNDKSPTPFSLRASILSRFLLSRLYFAFNLTYRSGALAKPARSEAGYEVRFNLGSPQTFDAVVWRHGPMGALERDFSDIWERCGGKLRDFADLDQTRSPIYGDAFNRSPSSGSGSAGAGMDTEEALALTPELGPTIMPDRAPSLDGAELVTLAGDLEAHEPPDPAVEGLASALPFSHWIPEYPTYVRRIDDEARVEARLREDRVVVITGMSGAGKSALCSALARRLHAKYDLTLWVDASELVRVEQLGDVDALRNGQRQNVLGILRRRRCLLVLDNVAAALPPDRLRHACGPGSRVLITSQHNEHADVTLGDVDVTTARAILEAEVETPCPDPIFATIWTNVGGHPLVLGILNRLVRSPGENWTTAERLCTSAQRLEDPERRLVCDRLLEAHAKTLRFELEFIRWCDSPHLDRAMFASVCGPTGERALASRNFLAAGLPGVLRVHDLVFRSIGVVVAQPTRDRAQELTKSLADHIKKISKEERLETHRVATLHHGLFGKILASERVAAIRYAYALPRAEATDFTLLGDPLADARRLEEQGFSAGAEMEIRAIIETIEAIFALTRRRISIDAARAVIREQIPAFDHLTSVPRLPDELRYDILHHRAKALSRAGELTEAEAAFRRLVADHPAHAAARIQLGRILKRQPNEVVTQVEAILRLHRNRPEAVSPTVYLAAFELLRFTKIKTHAIAIIEEYKTELVRILQRAAALGLDQPFVVVAALGQKLWYHAPELFSELLGALPERTTAPDDDDARFSWAQVQKFAAKAMLWADREKARSLLLGACDAYEDIVRQDAYRIVQHAECHLLLDEPSEALALLESVEAAHRDMFWHQRCAQAYRALGNLSAARIAIDAALTAADGGEYASTFRRDRWHIRRDAGESDAIDDLRAAVDGCEPGRLRDSLIRELAAAEHDNTAARS